ncbi:MAG: hypothetical protein QOK15_1642 [Nocardioidaceae bacterium]|jgi:hypothetical protein|nr:hypothetical protein [Nocardioidaceae bacterium]
MTTAPQRQRVTSLTVEHAIDDDTAARFYDLYVDTFGDLATLAVARQVLHEHEFMEEMRDDRVDKIVAWDEDGEAVGMCTLTKHLETVPWISPDYFAHHYPEHVKRGVLYYLGFILVAEQQRRSHLFLDIIGRVVEIIAAEDGMCAYDMCGYNTEVLGLADATSSLLGSLGNFQTATIDTQVYYRAMIVGPSKLPEMRPRSS